MSMHEMGRTFLVCAGFLDDGCVCVCVCVCVFVAFLLVARFQPAAASRCQQPNLSAVHHLPRSDCFEDCIRNECR